MEVDLPLDNGFLRRQCPSCDQEFKWHHGPVDGAPGDASEGEEYFCPLCGLAGAKDAFWTHEQLAFVQQAAGSYGIREIQGQFADTLKGSKFVKYTPGDVPDGPAGLFESEDMMEVQPPCHPWEPVKVPEGWSDPLHCLICGSAYRV